MRFVSLIEVIGASDDGGSLLHNKPLDYVNLAGHGVLTVHSALR